MRETTAPVTTHCRRCSRPLTSARSLREASRNGGYGRGCAAKIEHSAPAELASFKAEQVSKARELITDGALVATGSHLFLAVASDGATRYETDAYRQLCSCKAGQFGRRCYHLAAALILDAA